MGSSSDIEMVSAPSPLYQLPTEPRSSTASSRPSRSKKDPPSRYPTSAVAANRTQDVPVLSKPRRRVARKEVEDREDGDEGMGGSVAAPVPSAAPREAISPAYREEEDDDSSVVVVEDDYGRVREVDGEELLAVVEVLQAIAPRVEPLFKVDKGKGRAITPPSALVSPLKPLPILSQPLPSRPHSQPAPRRPIPRAASTDTEDDFFNSRDAPTKKPSKVIKYRRPAASKAAAAVPPPPPKRIIASSDAASDSGGNDSDEPQGEVDVGLVGVSKSVKLPAWTRGGQSGASRRLAAGGAGQNRKKRVRDAPSSDEDDEDEVEASESDDSLGGTRRPKVVRAKSRSLTPILPADPDILKQVWGEISENLPKGIAVAASEGNSSDDDLIFGSDPVVPIPTAARHDPVDDQKVTIRISMVFDPDRLASAAPRAVEGYQKPRAFELGRNEPFRNLVALLAASRSMDPSTLVLRYQTRKIYDFGTPASLKIFASADMLGYTTDIDAKVTARRAKADGLSADASDPDDAASPADSHADDDDEGPKTQIVAAGLFKVLVRGSASMVLPLAVRPTIRISALLKSYCKKFKVGPERASSMWLEFDGEKLDLTRTLEDYDEIEEEEAIDVREPRGGASE